MLIACCLIGIAVRTRVGRSLRERIEKSLFERLPGYALFRSLTQRLAGEDRESAWKPALVEIEEALVPGFIIEEFSRTAASPSSSRQSPRLSPEPSISSIANVSIRPTFRFGRRPLAPPTAV